MSRGNWKDKEITLENEKSLIYIYTCIYALTSSILKFARLNLHSETNLEDTIHPPSCLTIRTPKILSN
jgi:hypothetical protein